MERWYLDVLRSHAVFEGRARRKEFWLFTLVNAVSAGAPLSPLVVRLDIVPSC